MPKDYDNLSKKRQKFYDQLLAEKALQNATFQPFPTSTIEPHIEMADCHTTVTNSSTNSPPSYIIDNEVAADEEFYEKLFFPDDNFHYSEGDPDSDNDSEHSERESVPNVDDLGPRTSGLKEELIRWKRKYHITARALTALLKILCLYVIEFLPQDSRSLMKTKRNVGKEVVPMEPGTYIHLGLEKELKFSIETDCTEYPDKIELQIGSDGVPLSNSSSSQLYPILGRIGNVKNSKPFVIGCYHGAKKPGNCNSFLSRFIDEAVNLCTTGIKIGVKTIVVCIQSIICDAPALSFVKFIKNFNGFHGCTKCEVKGKYVAGRLTFEDTDAPKRTDTSFRLKQQEGHHLGCSSLEKIPGLDMIKNFPVDAMHGEYLGVMRRILGLLIAGDRSIRLSHLNCLALAKNLEVIRSCVPTEFARKIRTSFEVNRWKATEARQFALYVGMVLFRNILPIAKYEHFLNFCIGLRILSDPSMCLKYNNFANEILRSFVKGFGKLYDRKYVSYNIHNIIHLADDVQKLGPLDGYSAFEFENYMQSIKRSVGSGPYSLERLVNRLEEDKLFSESHCSKSYPATNFTKLTKNQLLQNSVPKIKSVDFGTFILSTKFNDNTFLLHDNSIAIIKKISYHQKSTLLSIQRFTELEPFFQTPCCSMQVGIAVINVTKLLPEECIPLSAVKAKIYKIPYSQDVLLSKSSRNYDQYVAIPLLH